MTSIERTAYPRLARLVTAGELTGMSPSAEEVDWARCAHRKLVAVWTPAGSVLIEVDATPSMVSRSTKHAGATIGEDRFRTRTGVSVVALVRSNETLPAPGPEVALEADDVVVAVGTTDGLRQLRVLLKA